MRTYKHIFYITLAISIMSFVLILVICDGNKASRIFTGLFTGSILGCITALINYISSRKQLLDNLYNTMTNIFVDLYGARDLLNKVEKGIAVEEVGHTLLKTFNPNISGASQSVSKAVVEATKIDISGYAPILFRSKALGILIKILYNSHHRINNLNSELLQANKIYLDLLRTYMPIVIDSFIYDKSAQEKESEKVAEQKRALMMSKHREEFESRLSMSLQMTTETINELSALMHKMDSLQTKSKRKWSSIEKAFTSGTNK